MNPDPTLTSAVEHICGDTVRGRQLCSRCGRFLFPPNVSAPEFGVGSPVVLQPDWWSQGDPWPPMIRCAAPDELPL